MGPIKSQRSWAEPGLPWPVNAPQLMGMGWLGVGTERDPQTRALGAWKANAEGAWCSSSPILPRAHVLGGQASGWLVPLTVTHSGSQQTWTAMGRSGSGPLFPAHLPTCLAEGPCQGKVPIC